MDRKVITDLLVNGPCGDGVKVSVVQISQNKARLRCSKCGAKTNVVLFGGLVDLDGLARLEEGAERLHNSPQEETN